MRYWYSTTCSANWRLLFTVALICCAKASSADASCGDYLHVKGMPVSLAETDQPQSHLDHQRPVEPTPCANGNCQSRDQLPIDPATTLDSRILEDIRLSHEIHGLGKDSLLPKFATHRLSDDQPPTSPFIAALDKPPQATFV
jgi:hypothetical protein